MNRLIAWMSAILISSLACSQANPKGAPETLYYLNFEGTERSYLLHLPENYDERVSRALILSFHGGGGNAENQRRVGGFDRLSDQQGFIIVYSNGSGRLEDKILTWNGGDCCGYALEQQIEDVGFVRALVNDLQTRFNIDPKRIYATGLSNGAILSYRLACEAADVFAAIAPVAGTLMTRECNPSSPVSVIHFHGTNDTHLPYDGGIGDDSLTEVNYTSVPDSIAFWIEANSCPSRADPIQIEDIVHLSYAPCAQNTAVELYKIIEGGHAWPGSSGPAGPFGDMPTESISATQRIWEFFSAHPKR